MPSISRHEFETRFADLLSPAGSVRLRTGESESVERAIVYLEADPTHWGSGYACAALIHRLKWLPLSAAQQERLRTVVLRAIDARDRQEFRSFCRLAASVQSPEFLAQLTQRAESPDSGVCRRAGWMLDYLARYAHSNRTA